MNFLKSISLERGDYSSILAVVLVLELFIVLSTIVIVLIGILLESVYIDIFFLRIEADWIPLNTWSSFWERPIQILAEVMVDFSGLAAGTFITIIGYQIFTSLRAGLSLYGSTYGERVVMYSKGVNMDTNQQNPANTWFPHKLKLYLFYFLFFLVQMIILVFIASI
ncbi:MAG: hypothetical protein ACXABU_03220 [Candidatus Hodarchaeales archaeon]|jgi:hypothetical protein